MQAGADWLPSLARLEREEREGLYGLSVVEVGFDAQASLQPPYLQQMLTGQLEPIAEGSSMQRIISPVYRMLLQVCKLPEYTQISVGL